MRASRPLVATRSGGAEEIIEDGENGFLVPVNDPDRLAERIIFLLQNDSLALKMGQRGNEIFTQRYSLDQFIRHFQRILAKATSVPDRKPKSPHLYLSGLTDLFLNVGNEFDDLEKRNQEATIRMLTRHQQEIDQLTHDFQSSRSWRITRPLRWLSRRWNLS